MHLRGELWVLLLFFIIAQRLPVHTGHGTSSKTKQRKKPETDGGGDVLMSHMCTAETLQPSARIFSFSQFVAVHVALYQPNMSIFHVLGMRQSTISYLPGAFTNSSHKTY